MSPVPQRPSLDLKALVLAKIVPLARLAVRRKEVVAVHFVEVDREWMRSLGLNVLKA